ALLAGERALRIAPLVDGRLPHPGAHRRLRQVQLLRDLPDALAARPYQSDHLCLVLGRELPPLPSFHGTHSPSYRRCPRKRGRLRTKTRTLTGPTGPLELTLPRARLFMPGGS